MDSIGQIRSVLLCALLWLIALAGWGHGGTDPVLHGKKKWVIALYEGGPYTDYTDSMGSLIRGLMSLGWIQTDTLPDLKGDVAKPYWSWLCTRARSDYLDFRAENAFDAHWDDDRRVRVRNQVIHRLQSGSIDLIVAMGTWAGKDLANTKHRVPTVVVSTSDPIAAGIIKSAGDSGLDHVTARVDLARYQRQARMFHRLVKFNTLGVAYENTPVGRLYSAIPDLTAVASERGFELVLCPYDDSEKNRVARGADLMACMEKLVHQSDAVYLTSLLALDETIGPLVSLLRDTKTPSFALIGSKYVKKGVLMSVSNDEGYRAQGLYDATKIARILNGAKPRDLKQEFSDPLNIAINMKTARMIGYEVPGGILRIAHEIYDEDVE